MTTKNQAHINTLITKVLSYAEKHLPKEKWLVISDFIKRLYAYASAEDLKERNIAELYGIALSFFELSNHRNPKELKVNVFNPCPEKDGWQSKHTIIQVVIDDMPFLVDSMHMEINRLGFTTHLMIHTGGIRVLRDENGYMTKVLPYDHEQNNHRYILEAPIYMEIEKQTDPHVLEEIKENIIRVLDDVRAAVEDWDAMKKKMNESIQALKRGTMPQNPSEVNEAAAFLEWILDNNFTFLGVRDYEVIGQRGEYALRLIPGTGLGVLRDESHSKMYRHISELPDQARDLMLSKAQILLISKTNTLSSVHRLTYTDYIGVKRFDESGEFVSERRFIGLFTSSAYHTNPEHIPLLRKKVAEILKKSKLPEFSHSGKDLKNILVTLPRDDLFQATTDELFELVIGILHLQERRRIRLFVRKDAYGRFLSCLVYIPRENFNTDIIGQIQDLLLEAFGGIEVSLTIHFSESILARIHFVVRLDPTKELSYDLKDIERKLVEIGKSWQDGLRENIMDYFGEEHGLKLLRCYQNAFPAGYRDTFSARYAISDIEYMEEVLETCALGMSFYRPVGAARDVIKFKLFQADFTVPLSDALPMLENMGLRVIEEQPYQITLRDGKQVWINDFSMTYAKEPTFEVEDVKTIFQEAFSKIWLGEAENDILNQLVLGAQLNWREISVLRAYTKYLRQTDFTFSAQYIAETLVINAEIAKHLIELFKNYFSPFIKEDRKILIDQVEALIYKKLDDVSILDEDRILRRFVDVIHATLRTNYFQVDQNGNSRAYISFKFDPKKIPDLPLPMPKYEIFVYSPRFEGVHLRMGKVARGGIRWSDRREDFRTEVLGLMKAQQVKNALIVPAGAKGGFVVKSSPPNATREEVLKEGIACYQGFIEGLLNLTDNLVDDAVIPPPNTICYDDHDTYLVVAADKGTATFSDIANQIAIREGYWLGDAFASGGSSGYDHKKMGITARGAWVSAERHFQELGINVDNTEITVIGIGDMSGDVLGNGLLMSKHIKLVCAFDHRHIFLDPNPSPEISYEERLRLFNLPRSTWDDYNREAISKGGGVYARSLKAIMLTPEVKNLLGVNKDVMIPNDLIKAIMRAPVDLIWNGGIGTFVKAISESNSDVGDRGNDGIRINSTELRARVVCEGGNLGLTQLARVEYELSGGKINTDFIDNSAGVDCSDHEVNIKILLNAVVAQGAMTLNERNELLVRMTDEVARLVLQDNYHQNLAISLASYQSPMHIGLYMSYIEILEEKKKINRALEFLPENKVLLERKAAGTGLTRPELAILFAYSKIVLDSKIRKSELMNDPYFSQYVKNAFPTPLKKDYTDYLEKHHLRTEIISTQISNQLVSEMGIGFVYQMQDETSASTSSIVRAYAIAREIFHLAEMYAEIESLDYKVETTLQYRMFHQSVRLVRSATRWLLRIRREKYNIIETIADFSPHVEALMKQLPKLLLGGEKASLEERRDTLIAANVPPDTALRIAKISPLFHSLNIIEAMRGKDTDIFSVAKIYFTLLEQLELNWFKDRIDEYPIDTRWTVLAKSAYKSDLDKIQRDLTINVLNMQVDKKNVDENIEAWFEKNKALIHRWKNVLSDLRRSDKLDFTILSVAIRELSNLTTT